MKDPIDILHDIAYRLCPEAAAYNDGARNYVWCAVDSLLEHDGHVDDPVAFLKRELLRLMSARKRVAATI